MYHEAKDAHDRDTETDNCRKHAAPSLKACIERGKEVRLASASCRTHSQQAYEADVHEQAALIAVQALMRSMLQSKTKTMQSPQNNRCGAKNRHVMAMTCVLLCMDSMYKLSQCLS